MLFKLSNLNSNFALTLRYLNPALNNSAQMFPWRSLVKKPYRPRPRSITERFIVIGKETVNEGQGSVSKVEGQDEWAVRIY